jgi:hypothetical protein
LVAIVNENKHLTFLLKICMILSVTALIENKIANKFGVSLPLKINYFSTGTRAFSFKHFVFPTLCSLSKISTNI